MNKLEEIEQQKKNYRSEWDEYNNDVKENLKILTKNYQSGIVSYLNPLYGKKSVIFCNEQLIHFTELEKKIRNCLIDPKNQFKNDAETLKLKRGIEVILNDTENMIKLLSGYGSKLSVELSINNSKFAIIIAFISLLISILPFFLQN